MKKNFRIFLEHILESIAEIEKHTKNISYSEFLKTTLIQDAVMRRLEILGEAVKICSIPKRVSNTYYTKRI